MTGPTPAPTTPYDDRTIVYVPIGGMSYIYRTNVQTGVKTDLGIVDVDTAAPSNAIFQANSPKPARAVKRTAAGSDSSFCDFTKKAALVKDKWNVRNPKYKKIIKAGASSKRVISMTVTIGTAIKYAWHMPLYLYTKISSELTTLGIEACKDADIKTYVWATTSPRPAQASKNVDADSAIYSTFISSAKADSLPAGWALKETDKLWEI